ncbi:SPOR domain-containing protein [Mariprofundus sp. KV]|uniref:SPOR domain-containing protein n=1 Tax=Mariprofundus sp. KV TaxID=2608715 RepID=UPI0015A4CE97
MSEENRKEPSLEAEHHDQSAQLDALIDQFDDDFDLEFANEATEPKPVPGDDEAPVASEDSDALDELLSELETNPEPEQVEKDSSSITVLLLSVVAIALLGTLIWQDFTGGKEEVAALKQPLINTIPAERDNQPVAVKEQQESLPASPEEGDAQAAAETEPMAAAVVKQQEPEMQREVEAPSATREVLPVDPVAPEVVTAKARKIFWAVNLTSVSTLASAEKIQHELQGRGVVSELKQATIGGKSYYRIRIGGFASKEEAEQARAPYMEEKEFSSAWLERYRVEAQLAQ